MAQVRMVLDPQDILAQVLRGNVINPDNICLLCGRPKKSLNNKGRTTMTCDYCKNGETRKKAGRKQKYTDEQIVEAVNEHGFDSMTVDDLLAALNLKSKTTLIRRLRTIRDAGLIDMVERSRHDGFIIKPKG